MAKEEAPSSAKRQKPNKITLYDAVAGRVGYEGLLSGRPKAARNRDTLTSTSKPVPPEEVLFRRKGAPVRYEEDDIYFADRHLQPHQRLPDSDLLKALHAYASDYYSVNGGADGVDFESLDESALLALGIFIEEAARAAVGELGDLPAAEGPDSEGSSGTSSTTSDDNAAG